MKILLIIILFGTSILNAQCPPPIAHQYKAKMEAAKKETADQKVRNPCVQGWAQLATWYAYKCECDRGMPTQENADALVVVLNQIQSTIQNMYPNCGEIPSYVGRCNVKGGSKDEDSGLGGLGGLGSLGTAGLTTEQAAIADAATELVSVGIEIANSLKKARQDNIRSKTKRVDRYISEINDLTQEAERNYKTNGLSSFLEKEKVIRNKEKSAIVELNWLVDKAKESRFVNQRKAIAENQLNRTKIILDQKTEMLMQTIKSMQNIDIINLVKQYSLDENQIYNRQTYYYGTNNQKYLYSLNKYRNEFLNIHQAERIKRVKDILDYDKQHDILNVGSEAAFYLTNAYNDYETGKKVFKYFESLSNPKDRYNLATWAIYNAEDDRSKLLLLLGEGNALNYYLDVNQGNKKSPKPLYQFLNENSNGFKKSRANSLVKNLVDIDENESQSKARILFKERKGCLTPKCIEDKSNMSSIINEASEYLEQKKYKKAITLLEMGINLYPESSLMYYYAGLTKSLNKNIFHAIKKSIDKKINVSLAKNISDNDKEAIAYFNKGIDNVKDNTELLLRFYNQLGNIYHKLEAFDKSDQAFDQALIIEPKSAFILNEYSWVLTERIQNLEMAEQMIKLCNEIEPNNYNYQDTYAWVLYKKGKYDDANNWLNKSINNGGNKDPIVWEHKGDVSYKLGNKDEALVHWKSAKSMRKLNGGEVSEYLNQKIKKKILIE